MMGRVKITEEDVICYDGSFDSMMQILRPEYKKIKWAPDEALELSESTVHIGWWVVLGKDGENSIAYMNGSDVPGVYAVQYLGNAYVVLSSLYSGYSGEIDYSDEGFFLEGTEVNVGDFVDGLGNVYPGDSVRVVFDVPGT